MSWSKLSVSAWLDYVMVKIVSFIMAGLCHGQTRPFQHGWNVSWSKSLVLGCLDYFVIEIIIFSMSGLCLDQNCPFQHGLNVSETIEDDWYSLDQVPTTSHLVKSVQGSLT
jgi:hypothetical protein